MTSIHALGPAFKNKEQVRFFVTWPSTTIKSRVKRDVSFIFQNGKLSVGMYGITLGLFSNWCWLLPNCIRPVAAVFFNHSDGERTTTLTAKFQRMIGRSVAHLCLVIARFIPMISTRGWERERERWLPPMSWFIYIRMQVVGGTSRNVASLGDAAGEQ